MNLKIIVNSLALMLLNFSCIIADSNEKCNFPDIPKEDEQKIEILFNRLFKLEPFAYTLYFDKPMSFCEYIDENSDFPIDSIFDYIGIDEYFFISMQEYYQPKHVVHQAWKTLEKYAYLFNQKNTFFLKENLLDRT